MRHLVYRVHALPQSLLPLVWDFGTLQSDIANMSANSVESAYIRQMIVKFVSFVTNYHVCQLNYLCQTSVSMLVKK